MELRPRGVTVGRRRQPRDYQGYDPAMRDIHSAGASALLLLALSSCGPAPAPPGPVPAQTLAPCHGEFVADVDTSVPGEATPEAAAVAWASSGRAPSGAPTEGWKATDEAMQRGGDFTVNSGDWTVGLTRTVPGGWLVSGLRCGE